MKRWHNKKKHALICEPDPPQLPHSRAVELNNSNAVQLVA